MVEVHVHELLPDGTGPAIYEGTWPVIPNINSVISWDDPKFAESAEPKRWAVVRCEYHWVTDCGMYVDLFVWPFPE